MKIKNKNSLAPCEGIVKFRHTLLVMSWAETNCHWTTCRFEYATEVAYLTWVVYLILNSEHSSWWHLATKFMITQKKNSNSCSLIIFWSVVLYLDIFVYGQEIRERNLSFTNLIYHRKKNSNFYLVPIFWIAQLYIIQLYADVSNNVVYVYTLQLQK